MAATVVVVPIAAYYTARYVAGRREPYRVETPNREFRITAKQVGKFVQVSWDPSNSVLGRAHHGHLFVDDGGRNSQVWLSVEELLRGSYLYPPAARRVQFRLEVYSVLSGQAIGTEFDNPSQAAIGKRRLHSRHRHRRAAVPGQSSPPAVSRIAEATTAITLNDLQPPEPAQLPAQSGVQNAPPPVPELRDDSDRTQGKRINLRDLFPPGSERPADTWTATSAGATAPEPAAAGERSNGPAGLRWDFETRPVPPSVFRTAIQKVPGVRLLQKGRYKAGPGFVPARPLSPPRPVLPQSAVVNGGAPVSVLARIDERGQVVDTRFLRNEPVIGRAVAEAVRQIRFQPARLDNTPVPSEVVIRLTPRAANGGGQ